MDGTLALKFFGALFAIMNPISNLPVFLAATEDATAAARRQIALQVTLYVAAMGTVIALVGGPVLAFFGISVDDFRVAGGLVVLLIGLNMLNGHDSSGHHGTPDEQSRYPEASAVAFYPLTFPILVGPGTITTLILFGQQAKGLGDWLSLAAVFFGVVAAIGAVFGLAGGLATHLSHTARVIMTRLMGMILAAIAVDMIVTGLRTLLPGLAG